MSFRNLKSLSSQLGRIVVLSWSVTFFSARGAEETARIPIQRPAAGTSVEFHRDVVPILRGNCLPCHNKTSAKADLLLESVADMLKGGESGPAIVVGKPAQSLLLRVATHEAKPRMPPKENKANARALTSAELGILDLWIEQGAKASERAVENISWQKLAPGIQNIAAVAVTADGRFAACGRGNRLAIYDLGRGQLVSEPTDPALGAAHRDTVDSIALSPDGEWLASGGYREVKLWQRHRPTAGPPPPEQNLQSTVLTNSELKRLVYLGDKEPARLTDLSGTNVLARLEVDRVQEFEHHEARRRTNVMENLVKASLAGLETARKELPKAVERRQKARDAVAVAVTNVSAKQLAFDKVSIGRNNAELDVLRAERTGNTNQLKSANEKREAAAKAIEAPERELKQATNKQSSAEEELRLAELGVTRASLAVSSAERALVESENERRAALDSCKTTEISLTQTRTNSRVTTAWFVDGLLVTAHSDGSRRTWNPRTGAALDVFRQVSNGNAAVFTPPQWNLVRTLGTDTNSPFADRINALAFRSDGQRLAIGSGDPSRAGDLHVLEPVSGEILYALTNLHSDSVLAVAWSPNGRWLATGGADRMARLVDTGGAKQERVFEGHTGHVLSVAWSPDGRFLATGGAESAVKFWEPFTDEKRKQATAAGKEITGLAFLTEEQVVGATGDPAITVWKVGGEKVRDYEKPSAYQQALAATPDGQTIVAGGVDGVLRVWKGTEAKPVWSFEAPNRPLAGAIDAR